MGGGPGGNPGKPGAHIGGGSLWALDFWGLLWGCCLCWFDVVDLSLSSVDDSASFTLIAETYCFSLDLSFSFLFFIPWWRHMKYLWICFWNQWKTKGTGKNWRKNINLTLANNLILGLITLWDSNLLCSLQSRSYYFIKIKYSHWNLSHFTSTDLLCQ